MARLGRYELLATIGSGGTGLVHAARAVGSGGFVKRVAVKRIHAHLRARREFVDMFLDEARIAAAIHHPNVAEVIDLGEQDGELYLAMEHLSGEHLGAVCARVGGPLPPAIAAHVIALAAAGLHHAHEARDVEGVPLEIVHRDVSPQNIFLTYDGQVKLTDFGIARAEGRIADTQSGRMKGKTGYMAPEQVLGQPIDRRADVFALGVVLYEILTAKRLFAGANDAEALFKIANHDAADPRTVSPECPEELALIVLRATARFAGDRYETAGAMGRALEAFVDRAPVRAADLAALMSVFAEERSAKERVFASSRPPDESSAAPAADDATAPATPRALEKPRGDAPTAPATPRASARPSPRRAFAPWVVLAIFLPFAAALGAATVLYFLPADDPRPERHAAIPPPEPERTAVPHPPLPSPEPALAAVDAGAPEPVRALTKRRPAAAPAVLSLLSRPWATVTINGRAAGRTPLVDVPVAPGRLRIELRAEGEGEPQRLTIDAHPGETISRSVRF